MSKTEKKTPNYANPERILFVTGEITEETAEALMSQLAALDAESSPDPIVVRITSHGGCGSSGFAVYDAIRLARQPVVTEVWGEASSIAALIFQAGSFRRMAPSARIMMHNGRGRSEIPMTAVELQREANDLASTDDIYNSALAQRAGVATSVVEQWCNEERYFNAAEAVAGGLADDIIGG